MKFFRVQFLPFGSRQRQCGADTVYMVIWLDRWSAPNVDGARPRHRWIVWMDLRFVARLGPSGKTRLRPCRDSALLDPGSKHCLAPEIRSGARDFTSGASALFDLRTNRI